MKVLSQSMVQKRKKLVFEHQTKTGNWDCWETYRPLRGFFSLRLNRRLKKPLRGRIVSQQSQFPVFFWCSQSMVLCLFRTNFLRCCVLLPPHLQTLFTYAYEMCTAFLISNLLPAFHKKSDAATSLILSFVIWGLCCTAQSYSHISLSTS